MKDEYISISEFARRAGVSPQAIYKRLSTDLSTELKVVDNQKMLKISALSRFGLNLVDNQVDNQVVNLAQGSNEQNDTLEQGILDLLRAELEAKNQQLREKDQRIAELTDRLAEMGMRAQELHAGTMVQQLSPGNDQNQEPVITVAAQEPKAKAAPNEPEPEVNKGRRHWLPWHRKENNT